MKKPYRTAVVSLVLITFICASLAVASKQVATAAEHRVDGMLAGTVKVTVQELPTNLMKKADRYTYIAFGFGAAAMIALGAAIVFEARALAKVRKGTAVTPKAEEATSSAS